MMPLDLQETKAESHHQRRKLEFDHLAVQLAKSSVPRTAIEHSENERIGNFYFISLGVLQKKKMSEWL